ncbi:MAG: hypothetical protein NW241_01300 [Bacteroidia bacterium]|nr:hypothetical protein [Bacteroidia bacterium]
MPTLLLRTVLLFACALTALPFMARAQQADSAKRMLYVKGSAGLTTNGFSIIPAFSLGKPAAVFIFNVNGGKRLSFEPEFRFSIDGRPWSFIFIGRYKLIQRPKFRLTAGTHLPGMPFRMVDVVHNGEPKRILMSQQAVAAELIPVYMPREHVRLGFYGLKGFGIDAEMPDTEFLALQAHFTRIRLPGPWYAQAQPQLFYLRVDASRGTYAAGSLTLAREGFPLSLSAAANQAIRTKIAGQAFNWNLTLTYSFDRTYVQQ